MASPAAASITRRDFLDGVALGLGAVAAPRAFGAASTVGEPAAADPSQRTGLQGQTDEVNAVAHGLRDDPARWRDVAVQRDEGVEDLVVVGAGISGLAGAHLFQRHAGRPVRMLLLDALDDVGGHARRNEFVSRSGRRIVGHGGSQSLDTPSLFSPAVHALLSEVGIDLKRFDTEFFDKGWASRHGLERHGLFFDRAAWGNDVLVLHDAGEPPAQWLARTPFSARAQADLARLIGHPAALTPRLAALRRLTRAERRSRLSAITYRDFLLQLWGVDAQALLFLQQQTHGYFGVGIEATSALDAWALDLPGFDALDLGDAVDPRMSPSGRQLKAGKDDYVYHFPDGNAGVARALIRSLIPAALPGDSMESLADARLDHARLDDPTQPVRLRLKATVVGLRHLGETARAELVELRYVDEHGRLRAVRARQVILACWHRVIARLADELPPAQIHALNDQVKVPLLYANVLVSNWQPWQRAGMSSFRTLNGFWSGASLDFPVSMGSLRFPSSPDEPMLLHLDKVVVPGDGALVGISARAQATAGRVMLAGWSFEHLEGEIRMLLQGALGSFGFDAAQDIEAITVNRWAHGYAYEYMRPWDMYWPAGPLPCERARRGWGRVAIANADAGAYAYAHSAIDQATRAVKELLPHAALPAFARGPGPDPRRIGLR